MSILALNKETAKLITTSQVITSIYSVVKELIENSLDAFATKVEVNLVENGISSIQVSDNGIGITEENASLVALKSYTSKIHDMTDLQNLSTYGFRGIALHALCALADVTIRTRTKDDSVATVYDLDHNGNITNSEPTHGHFGTTVEIRDLFKEFPVRRKILSDQKNLKRDLNDIEHLLKAFSICRPMTFFRLTVNGKDILSKQASGSVMESCVSVIGYKTVRNLESIETTTINKVKLHLMVPKKELEDLNNFTCCPSFVIVNDRPVQNKKLEKLMTKKITEYFQIKTRKIPFFFVKITVDQSQVDVNLEPNKNKIYITNQEQIMDDIEKIVADYYGVEISEKENQHDLSESIADNNSTISDNSIQDSSTEIQQPVFKKRKIASEAEPQKISKDKNLQKSNQVDEEKHYVNDDVASNCKEKGNKPEDFLANMNPLVLSESDSEMEIDKAKENLLIPSEEKIETGEALKKNDDESKSPAIVEFCGFEDDPELDQILAECFDVTTIENSETRIEKQLENPDNNVSGENFGSKTEPQNSHASSNGGPAISSGRSFSSSADDKGHEQVVKIGSAEWSKGHVPGGGGIQVSFVQNSASSPSKAETSKTCAPNKVASRTGFGIFCNSSLPRMREQHPNLSNAEIAKMISDKWRDLPKEERRCYQDLARERFQASPKSQSCKNKSVDKSESAEANRNKFVKLLENMKKEKKPSNNKPLNKRTIAVSSVTIQNVIDSFWDRKKKKKGEFLSIIGPAAAAAADDKNFLIAEYDNALWVVNVAKILQGSNVVDFNAETIDTNLLKDLIQQRISEDKTESIMHRFHDLS